MAAQRQKQESTSECDAHVDIVSGGAHILQLLTSEYVNGGEVTFGVAMLPCLRCGHVHHLNSPPNVNTATSRQIQIVILAQGCPAVLSVSQKTTLLLTAYTAQPEHGQPIRNNGHGQNIRVI